MTVNSIHYNNNAYGIQYNPRNTHTYAHMIHGHMHTSTTQTDQHKDTNIHLQANRELMCCKRVSVQAKGQTV